MKTPVAISELSCLQCTPSMARLFASVSINNFFGYQAGLSLTLHAIYQHPTR